MQTNKSAIYGIRNNITFKIYVGSTLNYRKRKSKNTYKLKSGKGINKSFQEDLDTYGYKSFEIYLIEFLDTNDMDIIKQREEYWIIKLETIKNGYNQKLPSEAGETKERYDKQIEGMKESYLFRTPHNLKKISHEDWLKNRRENPEFKVPAYKPVENPIIRKKEVFKLNSDFIIIDTYNSMSEAAKDNDLDEKKLQPNLKNNTSDKKYLLTNKSYVYVYAENFNIDFDFTIFKGKTHHNTKEKVLKEKPIKVVSEINIVNTTTNEIKTFNQYSDIANFLEVDRKRLNELKIGYKNKGGGKISNVTHIKGWKFV